MDKVRHQLMLPETAPRGRGVRIAVLDTGVDPDHPDLAAAVDHSSSKSLSPLSTDIVDRCYHGTHVSGIIAGSGASSDGRYRGIAPEAGLTVLKISTNGSGTEGDAVAGVEAAIQAGVDILNYSNGYSPKTVGHAPWVWPTTSSALEVVLELATKAGILCVVAAGNDGPHEGSINRPGGLECVLTVGATGDDGVLECSSRGPYWTLDTLPRGKVRRLDTEVDHAALQRPKPDLVAPGELIVAPRASDGVLVKSADLLNPMDPACKYIKVTGASQSTAVMTGIAACLLDLVRQHGINLGANPGFALKSLLVFGARRLAKGGRNDFGAGVLKWPMLAATVEDFVTDKNFRQIVLEGPKLQVVR